MSSELLASTERKLTRVIDAMERDFVRLRTGAASASLLEDIHVDHHGRRARLIEVATVTIPDPRQIVIQPWDPAALRAIGSAISQSRLGLTPTVDGPAIRIYVPAMTEDRRRELVQLMHRRMDQARVQIRELRHEALTALRDKKRHVGADDVRREEGRLQATTDGFIGEIDRLGQRKEKEIMRL